MFGGNGTVKLRQIGWTAFSIVDALAEKLIGTVAEELANTRADEGVLPFQIEDEDKVGETLEKMAAEFFLTA